jgi:protein-L-isoaspartate(D-aspartate) O-methyltransferase
MRQPSFGGIMRDLIRFYEQLDRRIFIDGTKENADMNSALNIVCGQTTPTPTTVMLMTRMLELDKSCKVLEIGTGSGYHAAFLAQFAGELYTVEIHPELAAKARGRLEGLGYDNITYKTGDGSNGWPEYAPYDRIVVTACAAQEPRELLEQLTPTGIMIAPARTDEGRQDLVMYYKYGAEVETHRIKGVRFVPMTGGNGK